VLWFGGCYFVSKKGIDVKRVLKFFKAENSKYATGLNSYGTYGIAFGLYKILMPARLLLTASVVPVIANYLHKDDEEGVFTDPEPSVPNNEKN